MADYILAASHSSVWERPQPKSAPPDRHLSSTAQRHTMRPLLLEESMVWSKTSKVWAASVGGGCWSRLAALLVGNRVELS